MRDFADTLNDRLMAMADEVAAQTPEPAPRRRKARSRRATIAAAFTTAAAGIGVFFAFSGTSLADLPILETRTTDASAVRDAAPGAASKGVDFSKAHVFGTPGGPGYVLVTPEDDTVCMVVPDPTLAGTYGENCGTPLSKVEAEGLSAEVVGDLTSDPNAMSLFAYVLPDGAKNAKITIDGRTQPTHVESGVVVASIRTAATVTWTVDGKVGRKAFSGPFENTGVLCPDGRSVPSDPSFSRPGSKGGPRLIDPKALAKACR